MDLRMPRKKQKDHAARWKLLRLSCRAGKMPWTGCQVYTLGVVIQRTSAEALKSSTQPCGSIDTVALL